LNTNIQSARIGEKKYLESIEIYSIIKLNKKLRNGKNLAYSGKKVFILISQRFDRTKSYKSK